MLLKYFAVSFFCTQLGLFLFHHFICKWIRRNYKHLSFGKCYKITTSFISGLQAAVVSILSLRTITVCKDILHDRDPVIEYYCLFMSFYFTYDIIVMYKGFLEVNRERKYSKIDISRAANVLLFFKNELLMIVHHAVLQCIGFPILFYLRRGLGTFFVGGFCIAEISTPFYSLRNILKVIGCTSGRLYEINGLLFISTFFVGRILIIPYLYYSYSKNYF